MCSHASHRSTDVLIRLQRAPVGAGVEEQALIAAALLLQTCPDLEASLTRLLTASLCERDLGVGREAVRGLRSAARAARQPCSMSETWESGVKLYVACAALQGLRINPASMS